MGTHRARPPAPAASQPPDPNSETYNIIPVHNLIANQPDVRAVIASLHSVGDLRRPPLARRQGAPIDLLDWLALFFGFQSDNVKNQREHLVLHLANSQMRLTPPPDSLDSSVIRQFRKKLLRNYSDWCSYLGKKSNIQIFDRRESSSDGRRELLYVSLYLLVWGESANLRFAPECICYIFHHMAMELNKLLEDNIDENTGQLFTPTVSGENAFLNCVVKPIYDTIRAEVDSSRNGTAPHSAWRNYDDVNEFFWSKRCFEKLKWPIDIGSNFFVSFGPDPWGRKVKRTFFGKTGFVEQRSFWNLFRSFDRLWIMLVLFLQAGIIVAWEEKQFPWQTLQDRDVQVRVLTVFLTWSGMRFFQSLLDAGMQYSLVSRETKALGVRMVMKIVVAAVWNIVFCVLYGQIWTQRNQDQTESWSQESEKRIAAFHTAALVFVIPEILSFIPWIGNFLEEKNWKILEMLSWWFRSRIFVGRGLREGLVDNIKYTLFWVVVLATKFMFSYFMQIKPMVHPTMLLLKVGKLNYEWHEFYRSSNRFAVVLLWLPVVLIYFMDLQIWYAIYSSFVGVGIGLFVRLGEIQNLQQLKLRFPFFASAVQFNLIPEEQLLNARGTLRYWLNYAVSRLKLRYGFGEPYKKLESNQVRANKFTLIWNEIIVIFREEDIISDRELELLELLPNSWNVRVVRWPCFLLCNELLLALGQVTELVDTNDKWVWHKICKNEYRRCAVIEAYDSVRHLLLSIVKPCSEEHAILTALFGKIDHSIQIERFTETFKTSALPRLHTKLIRLVELLNKSKKDVGQVVKTLQALYEIAIRDFLRDKRGTEQLKEEGLFPQNPSSTTGHLFENVVCFPSHEGEAFYRQIRRLYTILHSRESLQNVPINLEARRRIAFFSNSLFMDMPHAPPVKKMMAFSVLTPYYAEDVMYNREQLKKKNEDGISTLYYLQTIYHDEWKNFVERLRREGMVDEEEIWTTRLKELRLWASYRGNTLARTVRGMMYYYRALKKLDFLDSASEMDIREGAGELGSMRRDHGPETSASSMAALMKYTYVLSCPIYGYLKAQKKPQAEEILYLMKTSEALRVACVDEVSTGRDEKDYYSVLVKYDQILGKEVEIYRVKLPGAMLVGKSESKNHAFIFTRGDAVQTIDMNQDNYFEEALKMRNILEEFRKFHGLRSPTILGVREHIFTGSVSSLARFISAQETSFVTLGQRVLANPLKVRMHYGHPDVFDRFWFMTRGGLSKASRVINISEDIFAGFNCTLRGGNVTHHEYVQVGKGQDVGLNQVSMFEAKVASGNGEQVLSRDVYRLGQRLDFFRMLSFFYTTVGFFINTMMVILTVYAFLWGRLYLALSGIEGFTTMSSDINKALSTILNQQFMFQLGLFTTLPIILENSLEHGFTEAIWDFITVQLQLPSVFHAFSMGTRTHFFGRTILHGSAKYRVSGNSFIVQHKSFTENYRIYARSHFVKAIEIGLILIVYATHSAAAKSTVVYIALTVSSWFLITSWIMAPFLFNPSGFVWLKTVEDCKSFMSWVWFSDRFFMRAEQSWERWWYEEQDHLRTTGIWGKLLEIILNLRFFFFQYGIVYQLDITAGRMSISVYLLSWIFVFVVLAIWGFLACTRNKHEAKNHLHYRLVQFLVFSFGIIVIIVLLLFTNFTVMDIFRSMLAFLTTCWGLLLIAQMCRPFLQVTILWNAVVSVARLYDMLFGIIVMIPVALLSWLPGFHSMQNRILFNEKFSRAIQTFQIVSGKKPKTDS